MSRARHGCVKGVSPGLSGMSRVCHRCVTGVPWVCHGFVTGHSFDLSFPAEAGQAAETPLLPEELGHLKVTTRCMCIYYYKHN